MSYIDQLPNVRYDLAYHIGQYKRGFLRRSVVTQTVCDAVEGFCEATCVYQRVHVIFSNYSGKTRYSYVSSCQPDRGVLLFGINLCTYCNCRIVEQFDILKEEGV